MQWFFAQVQRAPHRVVLLAAALVLPANAAAQVPGSWELTVEGPRGEQTIMLVLEAEGDGLAGTIAIQRPGGRGGPGGGGGRGPGGGGPPEMSLTNGTVDGERFSFTATMSMRGNTITQEFRGTVDGDEMSGTISTPRGERPFTGRRVE